MAGGYPSVRDYEWGEGLSGALGNAANIYAGRLGAKERLAEAQAGREADLEKSELAFTRETGELPTPEGIGGLRRRLATTEGSQNRLRDAQAQYYLGHGRQPAGGGTDDELQRLESYTRSLEGLGDRSPEQEQMLKAGRRRLAQRLALKVEEPPAKKPGFWSEFLSGVGFGGEPAPAPPPPAGGRSGYDWRSRLNRPAR